MNGMSDGRKHRREKKEEFGKGRGGKGRDRKRVDDEEGRKGNREEKEKQGED